MEVKSAPNTTQPTTAGVTSPQTPPPAPQTVTETPVVAVETTQTAPVVETTGDKTPEVTKPEQFPKQFAIIAKREKVLTEREKALKAQTQSPEYQAFQTAQRAIKEGRKLEAIQALGLNYDDLTAEALSTSGGNPLEAENRALKEKLAKLEGKKPEETSQEDRVAQAKQTVANFQQDIAKHVEANKEKYPLTAEGKHADLVFQVIDEHHAKHGQLLSVDQAAAAVEAYIESEAKKLVTHPKFAPKPPTTESTGAPKQDTTTPVPPTLKKTDAPANTKQDLSRVSETARIRAVASKYNFFKD